LVQFTTVKDYLTSEFLNSFLGAFFPLLHKLSDFLRRNER